MYGRLNFRKPGVDQLATASGNLVVVHGILHFEFEDVSLRHYPVAEQRDELPRAYYSSGASTLWLRTGDGGIQLNESVFAPVEQEKGRCYRNAARPEQGAWRLRAHVWLSWGNTRNVY